MIGRERELAWLDDVWDRGRVEVAAIVGPAGIGKTMLIHAWRTRLLARERDIVSAFDWTFHGSRTREHAGFAVEVFLREALRFFGAAELADGKEMPWKKAKALADLVGRRRALLVLDGLEVVREDESIAKLLEGLAGRNLGLCVVVSREVVPEFEGFELEPLSREAGAELLRSACECEEAERLEMSEAARGHPLTLRLLGSHARATGRWRDIARADFQRVLEAYLQWLAKERPQQLDLLEHLALFDGPADPGCIAALMRPHAIDIDALEQTGLLIRGAWNPPQSCGYDSATQSSKPWPTPSPGPNAETLDLHPLVREFVDPRMRHAFPAIWRGRHARVYEHLCKSVPHWPEGLAGLLPLYRAIAQGCAAELVQQALDDVYHARILRGTRIYSLGTLGLIAADLAALARFFERAWDRPSRSLSESDQAWVLGHAATLLHNLGRLREASEPMRVALDRRVAAKQWKNASIIASNLAELDLLLGRTKAAIDDAARSLAYADADDDPFVCIIRQTELAHAHHRAGDEAAARELFERAQAMQGDHPPTKRLRTRHYAEFLLGPVERAAWRVVLGLEPEHGDASSVERRAAIVARTNQTLAWNREGKWRVEIALDQLTLGQAALFASLPTAREHIDDALDGLRKTGAEEWIAEALIVRASLHHRATLHAQARADLDEAWTIAERGPMPFLQADIQLTRARLFRDRAALDHARELIARHGYGRRLVELADAERAAQSWPERVFS